MDLFAGSDVAIEMEETRVTFRMTMGWLRAGDGLRPKCRSTREEHVAKSEIYRGRERERERERGEGERERERGRERERESESESESESEREMEGRTSLLTTNHFIV